MNKEIFKEVVGFQNYLVSNYGRIYSKKRKMYLKPSVDKYGYLYVNLSSDGTWKTIKVHRIVAEAFLGRKLNINEDIHHLVSKEDNCFEHMIVLPHSEHLKLHKFGTHHSEETKEKLRQRKIEYWQNKRKELQQQIQNID